MALVNVTFLDQKVYPGTMQAVKLGAESQDLAVSGTAATTSTVGDEGGAPADHELVRVYTDSDVRIKIGQNPTAVLTDPFLPAGAVEVFIVEQGDKVSIIQES
jgi:hypothetical protein